MIIVFPIFLLLRHFLTADTSLNVALHAQVHPNQGKIVGSAVTMKGLQRSLLLRPEIRNVEIFFPAFYNNFFQTDWDLIFVEGWFPSLDEFIKLSRISFPNVKIMFFCLDPEYPGANLLSTYDFDGILANSLQILSSSWNKLPGKLLLLAANLSNMNLQSKREFGVVYVGAGGGMLQHKPHLYQALVDAVQFNLRLHGSSWDAVPVLNSVWKGVLPMDELNDAYASAEIVLSSTIAGQLSYGMINNRIFDALAVGSFVVVDQEYPELRSLLGEHLHFLNATHGIEAYMKFVREHPEEAEDIRQRGRQEILRRHTWAHRSIEILDFYHSLHQTPPEMMSGSAAFCVDGSVRRRANAPRLLWVISVALESHLDYTGVVLPRLREWLCAQYDVEYRSEQQWYGELDGHNCTQRQQGGSAECLQFLAAYDVILTFIVPFDPLDMSIRHLPKLVPLAGGESSQRRMGYILGLQPSLHFAVKNPAFLHYDAVMHRSQFELHLMRWLHVAVDESRWQQCFGAPVELSGSSDAEIGGDGATAGPAAPLALVVCYAEWKHLCSSSMRSSLVEDADIEWSVRIVLLGGEWAQWSELFHYDELHRVTHLSRGSIEAVRDLFAAGNRVYMMHGSAEEFELCFRQSMNGVCTDYIGVFVAAAVARMQIFLRTQNHHFGFLSESHSWTASAFHSSLTFALQRLHGMASVHSMLEIAQLRLGWEQKQLPLQSWEQAIATVHCNNCTEKDEAVLMESQYGAYTLLRESTGALLRLQLPAFETGRDGQLCLQVQNSSTHTDADIKCLMRPFRYVAVQGRHFLDESGQLKDRITLSAHLRGNLFANVIHQQTIAVQRTEVIVADGLVVPKAEIDSSISLVVYKF